MAMKPINVGTSANSKNGDPLRTAFIKINENFTELYNTDTSTKYHLGDDQIFVDLDSTTGLVVIQSQFDSSMPVYIKGANCSDGGVGGNVVIEAGGAPLPNTGTTGNIELAANIVTVEANNNLWTFNDSGVIELPDDIGDITRNGVSVLSNSNFSLPTDALGFLHNDGNGNLNWSTPAGGGASAQTAFNQYTPELTYEEVSVYIAPSGAIGIQNLSGSAYQIQFAGTFTSSNTGSSIGIGSNYHVLSNGDAFNIGDANISNIGDLLIMVLSIPDVSKIFRITVVGGFNTGNPVAAAGYGNIIIERLI